MLKDAHTSETAATSIISNLYQKEGMVEIPIICELFQKAVIVPLLVMQTAAYVTKCLGGNARDVDERLFNL